MISGFNTDIEYEGVTYHVQTEDKGIKSPLILSLVYDRGTIVAAKRTPYDDLLSGELNEQVLQDRLQRQHKLICAAIRAGRIEDLKKMTAASPAGSGAPAQLVPQEAEVGPGIPMPSDEPVWDIPLIEDAEEVDDAIDATDRVSAMFEDLLLPDDAVEILGDLEEFAPFVDDELRIKLFGKEKFYAGEQKSLNVLVCRGKEDHSVPGATIMIKILGSEFRPLIFHSKADSNGIATVVLKIPKFRSGRAAILIRAMFDGEEVEFRRVISQRA